MSLPFATLYLQAPVTGLGEVLHRQLSLRPDMQLVSPVSAEAVLAVLDESMQKQILTVNKSGRVVEYQLVYRARFKLEQGGTNWIAPTELILRRDYSFDESNLLGKAAEERALLHDMHVDAAQQIIRRLAALKPQLAPMTSVPGK
ncbi:LPS-assembly lipoprotein LptE [Chitinimonas sp. BJB300]|uniref:LPS-assembly lipoprotein LptE n=1 Tax=Chitinimonas sp. BJB300 TaxID=1559339 RepID=UPI00130435B2|nr:LPS assembly lipoprotein LptE [Chitinimonas sp. BJB300]